MASIAKFSYQRLKYEGGFDDNEQRDRMIGRGRSWARLRKLPIKKRLKIKVPSLKKFLRRKLGLVLVSWAKVLKRLKESEAHFGELFAGNYVFMQVNTPTLKCVDKSLKGLEFNVSSRYSLSS